MGTFSSEGPDRRSVESSSEVGREEISVELAAGQSGVAARLVGLEGGMLRWIGGALAVKA
jgi:hypothetical protein